MKLSKQEQDELIEALAQEAATTADRKRPLVFLYAMRANLRHVFVSTVRRITEEQRATRRAGKDHRG